MNDVKLNIVAPGGPPNGSAAAGIASSAPQPATSRSTATDSDPPTSRVQEIIKNQEAERAAEVKQGEKPQEGQGKQKEQVQEAVAKLNDYIQSVQRDLEFNMDEVSGRVVVKVVDRNTNEVVRQIPDEVALQLARDLQANEPISLLNTKA